MSGLVRHRLPQPWASAMPSFFTRGLGNNKAIEIYNPTSNPIDMSDYRWSAAHSLAPLQKPKVLTSGIPAQRRDGVVPTSRIRMEGFEQPVWDELAKRRRVTLRRVYDVNNAMYFNGNDAVVARISTTRIWTSSAWLDKTLEKAAGRAAQNHTLCRPRYLRPHQHFFFDVGWRWNGTPWQSDSFLHLGQCVHQFGRPLLRLPGTSIDDQALECIEHVPQPGPLRLGGSSFRPRHRLG